MGREYVKKYELQTYDFNVYSCLKTETIMNFLQDITTRHYQSVVVDNPGYNFDDAIWVVVDWDVKIHKLPDVVMPLRVSTEPIYFRKFIGFRKYTICSESGECFVTAISKWAFIHKEKQRQLTIPSEFYGLFDVLETAPKPDRVRYTFEEGTLYHCREYTALYSDIDVNGHVNNVSYYRWVLDSVPMWLIERFRPAEIKINYKREVLREEKISLDLYTFGNPDLEESMITKGIIRHGETLCVICEIEWIIRN